MGSVTASTTASIARRASKSRSSISGPGSLTTRYLWPCTVWRCTDSVTWLDNRLLVGSGLVVPVVEADHVERHLTFLEAAHEQLTEVLELQDVDHALLVELEHPEEPHDYFEAGLDTGHQGAEAHRLAMREEPQQGLHRVAHARAHRRDVLGVDDRLGLGCEHPQRRGPQRRRADRFERVGHQPAVRLLGAGEARHAAARPARERVEGLRGVLERLALEQPGEEQVALLEPQQLFVELAVVDTGQQAPRLQLDERRRDQQELGRDVEIEGVHAVELGQVLVDDRRERHLPEVDLLLEDEVQQQIEGAFVDAGVDVQNH